jgi:predicted O-methyltransferase YrrM
MVASMAIEASTNGDIFEAFVEQALCPILKPGGVVVMDNLSVHN